MKTYDLPNESTVAVCDWITDLPEFMKQADVLFVDPPWNTGLMKVFYTKAGKGTASLTFQEFTRHLFIRIGEVKPKSLFLEIGKEHLHSYIIQARLMYKYVTFYNSTYYHKSENKAYVIHATDNAKTKRFKELEDLDEEKIIAWICKNHDYNCIGDLCMGTGLVGKYAYLAGRKFVGTELNHKRLAMLVDFIKSQEDAKGKT